MFRKHDFKCRLIQQQTQRFLVIIRFHSIDHFLVPDKRKRGLLVVELNVLDVAVDAHIIQQVFFEAVGGEVSHQQFPHQQPLAQQLVEETLVSGWS